MSIDTNIIFSDRSIFESKTLSLHSSGDFVRVTDSESNTVKFHKSSDISTITEISSRKTDTHKSGGHSRILISGQYIKTAGSITASGGAFISIADGSMVTYIPHQMFDEIQISNSKTAEENAKLTKMLSAVIVKNVDTASLEKGDSFIVTTSNRVIDVTAGRMKPEGNFLFLRNFETDTEYWIPSRLVLDIDFKG